MRPRFIVVVLYVSLTQILSAQPSQTSPPTGSTVAVVATINKDWSAKKLKVGDKVEAQVAQDVLANGKIAIPRDSKLVGRVTKAEALTESDGESRLAVSFDLGHLKKGGVLNFQGVIEALGPPLPDAFLEAEMDSSSPYTPGASGHPVMGSTGQSNSPTQVIDNRTRNDGARSIEERQRAMDDAARSGNGPAPPSRNGALNSSSRGVFGLPGLFLSHVRGISTIISIRKNVELRSGSQIVLSLEGLSRSTNK